MSLVFEQFFSPLDFTPSDTFASMFLVSFRQKFQRYQHNNDRKNKFDYSFNSTNYHPTTLLNNNNNNNITDKTATKTITTMTMTTTKPTTSRYELNTDELSLKDMIRIEEYDIKDEKCY